MLKHYIVLKTFETKQAVFLVNQRRQECSSRAELHDRLVKDLYSQRYSFSRISVPHEWLQVEVAKILYWRHRLLCTLSGKHPNFSISEDNRQWLSCLLKASNMIADCIELGYLKCHSGKDYDLLNVTLKGSQTTSIYPLIEKMHRDFGATFKSIFTG